MNITSVSNIRNSKLLSDLDITQLSPSNPHPRSGDLVLVSVSEVEGMYHSIELIDGRNKRLYPDDLLICTLGNRASGTKISGTVPTKLSKGDTVHLLSMGGIVGVPNYLPFHVNFKTPKLLVKGFLCQDDKIINTIDSNEYLQTSLSAVTNKENDCIVIVASGTSAESGKTTFICKAIQKIKQHNPIKIAAIKVCGTGRLSDMLRYKDAGADRIFDFANLGYPSTYGIDIKKYYKKLDQVISCFKQQYDVLFLEIGGDIIGAGAPALLKSIRLNNKEALHFLCVNDALGAMKGIELLGTYDITNIQVCTYWQNPLVLREKLNGIDIIDIHTDFKLNITDKK